MEIYSALGSLLTALSFVLFIGIVFWAWSAKRKSAFEDAASAPFALPDEEPAAGRADLPGAKR
jgi:cytochrome c oxidase cbb3-type subunit 4